MAPKNINIHFYRDTFFKRLHKVTLLFFFFYLYLQTVKFSDTYLCSSLSCFLSGCMKPHVHVKFSTELPTYIVWTLDWITNSSCVMDIFLPFGTQWFWALYLCMLDPADTYCAPFKPEETVYRFFFPFSLNITSDKLNIKKNFHLFIKVRYIIQRERQHELARGKNVISNNVLILLTYLRLVCCSMKLTAVVYYLFIWIYFNKVCYWSELHIYFVNHECLC